MSTEAIAVVGLSCRLPGHVTDPASAWEAAVAGADAVTPVPADRWGPQPPTVSGRVVPDAGGFLDQVDHFDAEFFGISPREAKGMDPVQRLLLELSVEALEDGGAAPHAQRGQPVGVYLGMGLSDYGRRHFLGDRVERIDAWSGTGTLSSVASGRIAYLLGLTGPALSVHTACSSSLVAIHLAVQALRAGQIDAALAGGANLLLSPEPTIYFAELQALSPTGRCRTFDAAADGYVRGEGGALFYLRRLSDAVRDGDRIHAVIRGSAVNQDGRSNGLTAPSGRAQEAVIRAALADAEVEASSVGMVEAHGTGTPLGDPIELRALSAVYGEGERPCHVVSAKTRVGHLEAAAGAAGMVQAVLALAHAQVPPHLHFDELNPRIELEGTRLAIPTSARPWTGRRRAAVSSFGLSGTNAHIVLEQAPAGGEEQRAPASVQLVAVSGHSPAALQARLEQVRSALREGQPLPYVAAAASVGRQAHRHRAVAVSAGELGPIRQGHARRGPEVVFAFTGQGSQRPGMALKLLEEEPVFRAAFDRCDALWMADGAPSLRDLLAADAESTRLHETEVTQPVLFAVGWALAALWRSWGVEPAAVLGHSIGEITAAAVAGVMSLDDAMRLVIARGKVLGALPRDGAMVAVRADVDVVQEVLDGLRLPVDIAAVNAPDESVISGERGAVLKALARFEERGVRAVELRVSHAFHSVLVEPALDPFAKTVRALRLQQPTLPLYSAFSGRIADADVATPAFWVSHIRGTVRFADAVRAAVADGLGTFVECGPRPVLSSAGSRTEPESRWTGALHPDHDDRTRLLEGLGTLFLAGLDPLWNVVHQGAPRGKLPPYPFQRKRHWLEPLPRSAEGGGGQVPLYRVDWVRAAAGAGPVEGTWVVVGNPGGCGGALQSRLHDLDLEAHCCPAVTGAGPFRVVAFVEPGVEGMVRVAELLARDAIERLVVVVRGEADDPDVAMLEGLAAGASVEHPERFGAVVRMAPDLTIDDAVEGLLGVLRSSEGDDRWAVDAGGLRVPRLSSLPAVSASPPTLDPDAAYLVTGGLGRIGLAIASLLVDLGARHLVLTSRRGLDDDPARIWVRDAVRALEARDVDVRVVAADVADVDALMSLRRAGQRRIRGVVHAAGVSSRGPLVGRDAASLAEPLSAKLDGARALYGALAVERLDFFLLLSSVSAVWGAPDLVPYGAANATLHGLARQWRAEGIPATAVAMGPWAVGGMVSGDDLESFRRLGVRPLLTDVALETLARLMGRTTPPVVCLADLDLPTFVPLVSARRPRPLFAQVCDLRPEQPSPAELHVGWLQELHDTPEEALHGRMQALVRAELAAVLGRDPGAPIDPDTGFFDLGLDSLMAVELADRLRGGVGRSLPATIAFDHPTLSALSTWLLTELELATTEAVRGTRAVKTEVSPTSWPASTRPTSEPSSCTSSWPESSMPSS